MCQQERKTALEKALIETRSKTLNLLEAVPDEFLKARVHEFYSPVGWHFGHVGMTEEYWVRTRALGLPPRDERLSFLFANLPENPKDNRVNLPSRSEIVEYLETTRDTTLRALASSDLSHPDPLVADGYAWEFAIQHECQHQETICELLQLINKERSTPDARSPFEPPVETAAPSAMASLPGGCFIMGSDDPPGYDNEKPAHEVEVPPFELDRTPVTAGQWALFIADGGYQRANLWSEEGWAWRTLDGAERPEYWRGGACYCGPLGPRPLRHSEPVSSVSWYEADAYARWAGKRLPTEAEWEYAARFDPVSGESRRHPWGGDPPTTARASFGLNAWEPGPAACHPAGESALGLLDMAGGVWEWTSTPFLPYAGFEAFPYDGYSKEHMDGRHFVCRGGSWASAAMILRCSFRNWYVPTYRQGFLGLRCAR